MRKILGISVVALVLAVSAFGQTPTPPFVTYTLKLGGDNHAAQNKGAVQAHVPYTPGSTQGGQTVAGPVVNWSVDVTTGGLCSKDSIDMWVGGVANVVWDLKLKGPDGNPVPGFGLGSASTKGFFSTINDGTQGDPLEAAAFPWVFNFGAGPDNGRVFDAAAAGDGSPLNGPHLDRYQYPSTSGFPNGVLENPPRGVSQAASGTLMGMGAGYKQYNAGATPATERGGVGIADAGSGGNYFCFANANPIAEGQLNVAGLPGGTYTLELTAGKGTNVIWHPTNYCMQISGGAFAKGVPGGFDALGCAGSTLTGSSITFVIAPWQPTIALAPSTPISHTINAGGTVANDTVTVSNTGAGTLAFTASIQPPSATWVTVSPTTGSGGPLTISYPGASALAPGTYNATLQVADANATNSPQTVGITLNVNGCAVAPVLVSADSVKVHGGTYGAKPITFWAAGAYVPKQTECRVGGASSIVLTFDKPIGGTIGAVAQTGSGKSGVAGTAVVAGNTLTIPVTGVTNKTSTCITVSGVSCDIGGAVVPDFTIGIVSCFADVNGDGTANSTDANQLKSASKPGAPSSPRFDINLDGTCNSTDANQAKSASAPGAVTLSCQ